MAHLAYLEPDDELTSAAARIRTTPGDRVGLVLPFNSRVATSRINFRLLAREADDAGKTVDIIAPDAAARALAEAAGLRAFATVGEYEAAADGATARWTDQLAPGITGVPAHPDTDDQWGWEPVAPPQRPERTVRTAPGPERGVRAAEPKVVRRSRPMLGTAGMVALLVLALAVALGGAAAGMLLPAAEITVTAKAEPVPALDFTVVADPQTAAPDAAARTIPAQVLELPVEVSGEYAATGKKVTETKATGQVTWTNCDPSKAVTVPAATVLKTASGIAFKTTTSATASKAKLTGVPPHLTLTCQTVAIGVAAAAAGPAGNVAAGQLTKLPAGYSATFESVTNAAPTAGGTHTETTQVAKADVDAALKALRAQLADAFAAAVASPPGLASGVTAYPETAVMGDAVQSVESAALVGTEVESFSLGLSATGTMLAVDPAPIKPMGEAAITGAVAAGYRLVPGSVAVTVGTGAPDGNTVSFAVHASARRVRMLDAAVLKDLVLGKSEAEARAALAGYGETAISLWPGWVTSVPSNASRVTVTVADELGADGPDGPGASHSPVPSGS